MALGIVIGLGIFGFVRLVTRRGFRVTPLGVGVLLIFAALAILSTVGVPGLR